MTRPATQAPTGGLIRAGLVLFAIGLLAVVLTFADYALGHDNRPLWQNLLCVLAPAGFGLALIGLVRDGRAQARTAAGLIGPPPVAVPPRADRVVAPVVVGWIERTFRWVAATEATSWLVLIVATVVKYAAGWKLGVQILGPTHGGLFIAYVLVAIPVALRRRWSLRTVAVVALDSVIPTGGYWVARRRDLR
jgi:integral membrane protein